LPIDSSTKTFLPPANPVTVEQLLIMADAIGFALNLAGVVVPLGLLAKPLERPSLASTNVQIIAGHGDATAGGGCPDIALWDNS
jgi:hypothetical protein